MFWRNAPNMVQKRVSDRKRPAAPAGILGFRAYANMPTLLNRMYKRGYEGLNYRLRSLAGGRFAGLCRPVSISFLMTERCNARCVHCDIWKNRGKEDRATAEVWRVVLADLRNWLGPVHVLFTGGEALLNPDTIGLVSHAVPLGLHVEVLTNAYWPDQSRIEALARARPWRITVSLDGVGPAHSFVRGREDFYERTSTSLQTLLRLKREEGLGYGIRLKTVLMQHNLEAVAGVAEFAAQNGIEVFYQPIEQNYNTPEDPEWFLTSANWPRDVDKAISVVEKLIELKRQGLPVANSFAQLEAMIPYFRDPGSLRRVTQAHSAHERRALCAALATLQFQPNGDVLACTNMPPVGNVRQSRIRDIWASRPRWWEAGCCLGKGAR